jgi:hypothetical protein
VLDADRWPWVRFIGPALITVGGLLGAAGSWLNWFRRTIRFPATPLEIVFERGVRSSDGQLVFAFALIALGGGVLILYLGTRRAYLWVGVVALISGLWITGISSVDATFTEERFIDSSTANLVEEQGIPEDQAAIVSRQLIDDGVVTIKLQLGIFLAIAGGAAVIVGSVLSLLTRLGGQEPEPVPEEPEEEYDYLSDESESVYEPE